jgi:uncharacterized membrane protein
VGGQLALFAKNTGRVIEIAGIAVIVFGIILATVALLWRLRSGKDFESLFHRFRTDIGRAILLGLELLVGADIIGTVAVEPSFHSLGILAVIVAIRTFLSFSLEVEITGRWPWQPERTDRASVNAA